MFDIGFWELITIAILALIIVRPEKLPKFAKDAGKLLKSLRNYVKKALIMLINLWKKHLIKIYLIKNSY